MSLPVSPANKGDEPGVFHPQERAYSTGEGNCETHRNQSDENPGVVYHGSPFQEPVMSAPCLGELYRRAIPDGSPMR